MPTSASLDRELLVAEFHTGLAVGVFGMALRQAHRHVQIVGAAGQRAVEDRHHETWVHRIHDVRDLMPTNQFGNRVGGCRVDLRRGEPRIAHRVRGMLGAALVVVAHDELLEEVPSHRNRTERRSDTTGAH